MKGILICSLLVICLSIFSSELLDEYIERGNIKGITDLLVKSPNNERIAIIDKMISNRKKFTVYQYSRFMEFLKNEALIMKEFAKRMENTAMDEGVYPYMLEYFEIYDNKNLIPFILKHQDDDIDYYKYAKIFHIKGILDDISAKTGKNTKLDLNANFVMYSITGNKKHLDRILLHEAENISILLDKGFLEQDKKEKLIVEMAIRGKTKGIENIMIRMAIYNLDKDFSHLFERTEYAEDYKVLRTVLRDELFFDNEFEDKNESSNIFQIVCYLLSKNFEMYEKNKSKINDPALFFYLDALKGIFNSNTAEFKENMLKFINSEKENKQRIFMINLFLMTEYIEEGVFYIEYIKNIFNNSEYVVYITAKNTPVYYDYLIRNDEGKKAYEIKQMLKERKKMYAHTIFIDYLNNNLNKNDIYDFLKKYPDFPLNHYLKGLVK